MNKAIVVSRNGGPEVLEYADWPVSDPGPGEVRIRHEAIGLNFIDVYHRTGLYSVPTPFVPGSEGAGVITAVGEGVNTLKVGDRVGYFGLLGAYCQERNIPAIKAIPLPVGVDADFAAAMTLKGLTAYYLMEMTWPVKRGDTILFHAAAGGVGQLAVQWGKSLGARMIATVGSPQKAEIVRNLGIDEVIDIRAEPDFPAIVREMTSSRGVDVVYDSIGKDTFERSLDCLRPRGLMVSFGNASGPVSIDDLGILATKGSLYLTRPTLVHHFPDPDAEREGTRALFHKLLGEEMEVHIGAAFPLQRAADAHRALESRQTTGSTILKP